MCEWCYCGLLLHVFQLSRDFHNRGWFRQKNLYFCFEYWKVQMQRNSHNLANSLSCGCDYFEQNGMNDNETWNTKHYHAFEIFPWIFDDIDEKFKRNEYMIWLATATNNKMTKSVNIIGKTKQKTSFFYFQIAKIQSSTENQNTTWKSHFQKILENVVNQVMHEIWCKCGEFFNGPA